MNKLNLHIFSKNHISLTHKSNRGNNILIFRRIFFNNTNVKENDFFLNLNKNKLYRFNQILLHLRIYDNYYNILHSSWFHLKNIYIDFARVVILNG